MRYRGYLAVVWGVWLTSCSTPNMHHATTSRVAHPSAKKNTHQAQQDGAPLGPLPRFFNALKPKRESLSRYGNPGTYRVNGHTYDVLTSSSGYRTRGLASWYGTKFHRQRTSSGEMYDMYALTAAHKTLPLPTYVKITNLKNHRVAIVKVNDRGPFHSDRVIDLSYAAAVKLGVFPIGTAPVEIEALTTPGMKQGHVAHYYLQVGAFSSKTWAEALRQKLAHMTPSPVFVDTAQQRFLVRVGPFAQKKMAERLKTLLLQKGVKGAFLLMM